VWLALDGETPAIWTARRQLDGSEGLEVLREVCEVWQRSSLIRVTRRLRWTSGITRVFPPEPNMSSSPHKSGAGCVESVDKCYLLAKDSDAPILSRPLFSAVNCTV
jgi:hypothetical protein